MHFLLLYIERGKSPMKVAKKKVHEEFLERDRVRERENSNF